MAEQLMNPKQTEVFHEVKNLDMSSVGAGDLRFRINIFIQKESVAIAIRNIPSVIPPFEELACRKSPVTSPSSPTGWC